MISDCYLSDFGMIHLLLQIVEPFTAHYVFALGVARFLSCAHWVLQVRFLLFSATMLTLSFSIHKVQLTRVFFNNNNIKQTSKVQDRLYWKKVKHKKSELPIHLLI
jgi:hypothetical protein